jgi:hypothetical protein
MSEMVLAVEGSRGPPKSPREHQICGADKFRNPKNKRNVTLFSRLHKKRKPPAAEIIFTLDSCLRRNDTGRIWHLAKIFQKNEPQILNPTASITTDISIP